MAENIKQELNTFTMPLAGYSLIEASAGSGKTYTIVNLYLRLILRLGDNSLENPLSADEILVVTFTRAATNEMSQRIRRVLAEYSLMLRDLILKLEVLAREESACQNDYQSELQRIKDQLLLAQEQRQKQGKFGPSAAVEQTDCFYILPPEKCEQALEDILTAYKKSGEDFFKATLKQLLLEGRLVWAKQRLEQELARDKMQIQTLDSFTISALKNFGISTAVSEFEIKQDRAEPLIEKALENFLIQEFNTEEMQKRIADIPLFTLGSNVDLADECGYDDYFYGYWKKKSSTNPFDKKGVYFFHLVQNFVSRYTLQDIENLWRRRKLYTESKCVLAGMEVAEQSESEQKVIEISSAKELYDKQCDIYKVNELELLNNASTSQIYQALREWQVYALHWVYKEVMRLTRQERIVIDYSDYHRELLELVRQDNSPIKNNIRNIYKFAIIDEFQDTSPLQFELFNEIFIKGSLEAETSNLVSFDAEPGRENNSSLTQYNIQGKRGFIVIGDPKQAIYAFRGADIFCYFNARSLAQNIYTIAYNFRSESSFVETCNLMFGARKDAFRLAHIEYEFAKPKREMGGLLFNKRKVSPMTLANFAKLKLDSKFEKFEYLARLIQLMIKLGEMGLLQIDDGNKVRNLLPSDICVIETSNENIKKCVDELRKVGINTKSNTKINLADKDNDKNSDQLTLEGLKQILTAIVSQETQAVNQSLFSIFSGYTFEQAIQILNDSNLYSAYLRELQELHELWETRGFAALIDEYILRKNLLTRALAVQDKDAQPFLKLQELRVIVDFVVSKCEFINTNNPYRILKYIENLDGVFTSKEDLEIHIPGIEDKEAVKFYTTHSSKGLEFSVVLSTSISYSDKTELNLNHLRPNCIDFYNIDPEELDKAEQDKKLYYDVCDAEKQRLFYVLLTRAKYALFSFVDKDKVGDVEPEKELYDVDSYTKYAPGNHKNIDYAVKSPALEKVQDILQDKELYEYQARVYDDSKQVRTDALLNSLPRKCYEFLLRQIKEKDIEYVEIKEALDKELILNAKVENPKKLPWMAINPDATCADVSLFELMRGCINLEGKIDYARLAEIEKYASSVQEKADSLPTLTVADFQKQRKSLAQQVYQLSSWIPLAQPQATSWEYNSVSESTQDVDAQRNLVRNQLDPWLSSHMRDKSYARGREMTRATELSVLQGYTWLEHGNYQLFTSALSTITVDGVEQIKCNSQEREVQVAQNYTVPQHLTNQQDLISFTSLSKYKEQLIPVVAENFEQLLATGKVLKSQESGTSEYVYDLEQQPAAPQPELLPQSQTDEEHYEQQRGVLSTPDSEEIRVSDSYLRQQKVLFALQQQCWNAANELVKLHHNLDAYYRAQGNISSETSTSTTHELEHSNASLEEMFEFLSSYGEVKLPNLETVRKLLQDGVDATWTLGQWQELQTQLQELIESMQNFLEQGHDLTFAQVKSLLNVSNSLQVALKELLEWLNINLHGNVFEPSEQYLVNLNNPSFILENLPSGKDFGLQVHEYLEKFHPTQTAENVQNLTRACRDYNRVETQVIKKLIHDVLNYPLLNLEKLAQNQVLGTRDWIALNNSDNLFLNPPEAIDEKQYLKLNSYGYDRVTEWKFDINLALESMDFLGFCNILHRHGVLPQPPDEAELGRKLRELRAHGTFNGFVDLILFTPQACVVIDYKTNNLGSSLLHYHPKILSHQMLQTGYILQSYIYLTAVFSYCLDYVFTTVDDLQALNNLQFVGIHAFLRGMLKDNDQKYLNSGVYTEIPNHKLLAELALHLAPYLPYREGRMELLQRILSEESSELE